MLTDASIRALKPENGRAKRRADRDGLFIEARTNGKKVFIFRFQWDKKPQTITIGNYPSISLAEARTLATAYQESLNQDRDPRETHHEQLPKKALFTK